MVKLMAMLSVNYLIHMVFENYRRSLRKVQRVIEKHQLYYHPIKTAKIKRKRQKAQKKKRITELQKKKQPGFLICFDVIEIFWNGLRRYIFTAVDSVSKVAFARN